MAGGPQVDTELEVFQFVYDGMQKGAIGVNLGRNIWQNDFPVAMIKAIRAIIHEGATPEQAQELYDREVNHGELPEPVDKLLQYCLNRLQQLGIRLETGEGISGFYKDERIVRIPPRVESVRVVLASLFEICSRRDWEEFCENYLKPRMKEL